MRSPPPTPPGAANGAPTCTRAGAAAGGGKAAVSRDNEQGVQAARPGTPGPKGAVRPVQGSGRRLSLPPRLPHPTGVRLPQKGLRRSWAGRWVRPPGTSRRLRLGLRDWGAQGLRPPRSPRSPRSPRPARPGCRDVALTYHSSESGTGRRRLRGRRLPALRMRGPAPPRGTPHPAQAPPRPRPVLKPRPGRRSSTGLNPRGGREPVGVGAGGRPDSAEAGRAAALGVPTAHQGLIRSRYRGAAREAGPEVRRRPAQPEGLGCGDRALLHAQPPSLSQHPGTAQRLQGSAERMLAWGRGGPSAVGRCRRGATLRAVWTAWRPRQAWGPSERYPWGSRGPMPSRLEGATGSGARRRRRNGRAGLGLHQDAQSGSEEGGGSPPTKLIHHCHR